MVIELLVLSIINYDLKIWGTTSLTQINRVQKAQNFVAKVAVGGVTKYDHVTPCIQELVWLKIKQKYMFDLGITVFDTVF